MAGGSEALPAWSLLRSWQQMRVMSAERAVGQSDVVVTVTGRPGAVTTGLLERLRDRAVLANVGHFATEIDVPGLERMAAGRRQLKDDVEEFTFPDGRVVYLLARGEMLNLAAASGHQIQIMDLGFALQAHSLRALSADLGHGEVRGRGLLLALALHGKDAGKVVDTALERGLLINAPRPDSVRFMPALTVTRSEIDRMVAVLEGCLA